MEDDRIWQFGIWRESSCAACCIDQSHAWGFTPVQGRKEYLLFRFQQAVIVNLGDHFMCLLPFLSSFLALGEIAQEASGPHAYEPQIAKATHRPSGFFCGVGHCPSMGATASLRLARCRPRLAGGRWEAVKRKKYSKPADPASWFLVSFHTGAACMQVLFCLPMCVKWCSSD